MKEINLREFYPEIYKTDLFISLPDEVVDVLVEYQRKEVAYRRRTYRHKAYLSLDYGDDIEREAVLFTPTLQEIVERHLEEERVYQAISSLPEKQRQILPRWKAFLSMLSMKVFGVDFGVWKKF